MHHGEPGAPRSLELRFVFLEIRTGLGVRHRLLSRRVDRWAPNHVTHLSGIMLVLPRAPQLRVGHVGAVRDLLEEFLLWNLRAIIVLESEQQPALARLRTREEALILLRIKAPFGLQVRRVVQKWRRRVTRELTHF